MAINFSKLSYLQNITAADIPKTHQHWLCELKAPTVIDFKREGCDRWRVVTTLLHGNEPSGFIALHQWILRESYKDMVVNIRFIVCSIEAAQFEPLYTTRFLSGGKDINRCFGVKSLADYYLRAELIASCIRQVKPEAIVDLHNTSGKSQAFGVSCYAHQDHLAIASLFCDQVIISHLKLGALMEQDFACSILTIECGQSTDQRAHDIALTGIERFCSEDTLLTKDIKKEIEVIHQPIRLRINHNVPLTYSQQMPTEGVSLRADIEDFNAGITKAGTSLGWLDENALNNLNIEDEHLHGKVEDFFEYDHNQLICKYDLRIYMATTKTTIAVHDCLFYFVKEKIF